MARNVERVEVNAEQLASIADRARGVLSDEEYKTLRAALETLSYLTKFIASQKASLRRLREVLFGSKTEKTAAVLDQAKPDAPPSAPEDGLFPKDPKAKPQGHGRNGAQAYGAAERETVAHPTLKPKDRCPECRRGKLYALPPAQVVRVRGQAPLGATVYELGRVRCNLCGQVFTAPEPGGAAAAKKYDATAGSMIALLKYGSGLPFHRLEALQRDLETPLPTSTQWEIVRDLGRACEPVHQELIRQAAQGEVLHNDDTGMKILELMKEHREQIARGDPPERTGVFTSGIVSTREGRRIALFFTGKKHAGENLAEVLARRKASVPPIQMCDGLSRNLPHQMRTIVGNCLAHGRRQFVELVETFPEHVEHLLVEIGKVYENEAKAKAQKLSAADRLRFHQERSAPVMKALKAWFEGLLANKQVEPHSGLGKAIRYMLKRWDKLTLFLRAPGVPLDNNLCERALKKAILNRKNAYFYKTQKGARIGDLFMSLIATCQLVHANPFEYLTALQQNLREVHLAPQRWMPWNYKKALRDATQN